MNLFMKLLSKIYKTATHDVAVHIQNPLHEKELLQKINQVGKNNGKGTQPTTIHSKNQQHYQECRTSARRTDRKTPGSSACQTVCTKNIGRHDLWKNQHENLNASSVEDTANLLAQHFPKQEIQWTAPTYWELLNQVRSCHGSSGPDSWHSNAVRHLPEKAIQIFRIFAQRWGRTQQVPKAMTQGRMTSLIKPGRIQNQEIATCDLRPITVLNVWWRCWAGAWAHCISMKHYAKALPPFVSGIHQHLGTEESATILQDAFVSKNGFLFSLDYKKAFDRMNANSSSSFLQKIGFPTSITSLIQQVWNTQRTVQYGQSLSPKVLQGNCTPQGCPLAPITLVSWMVSGQRTFLRATRFKPSWTHRAGYSASRHRHLYGR